MSIEILGFGKMYNEGSPERGGTGNLKIYLEQMKKICGEGNIVLCDCDSTDDSVEIAKQYTSHIISVENDFSAELIHKQKLLEIALSLKPKYILWLDIDEILDARAAGGIKQICEYGDEFDVDGFNLHTYNLWGSPCWIRTDSLFFDKWDVKLWKNNGKLKFSEVPGLHQPQHPQGLGRIINANLQVIHRGFSDFNQIARKYMTYKKLGQAGWYLDRLRPDNPTIQAAPVDLTMFPEELRPLAEPPAKITAEEFDKLCQKYQ